MSIEQDNKAIVGRWFTSFWGKTCDLGIVDVNRRTRHASALLAARAAAWSRRLQAFMTDFRKAFPDLNFWGVADLIAEGDYVVGRWQGGGTHTGPGFNDFLVGRLPAATGRKMHFTGNDGAAPEGRKDRRRDRPG